MACHADITLSWSFSSSATVPLFTWRWYVMPPDRAKLWVISSEDISRSEIWLAVRQICWRTACQISKWCEDLSTSNLAASRICEISVISEFRPMKTPASGNCLNEENRCRLGCNQIWWSPSMIWWVVMGADDFYSTISMRITKGKAC